MDSAHLKRMAELYQNAIPAYKDISFWEVLLDLGGGGVV